MTLRGLPVLVTRAVEDAAELEQLLLGRGAIPLRMPCIEFQDLPGAAKLAELVHAGGFDLVVVASPHAARRVSEIVGRTSVRFAAVGRATAERLTGDVIVPRAGAGADALLAELGSQVREKRVLLPQPEQPTPGLYEGLLRAGARVERLPIYRTTTAKAADLSLLRASDAITFASGSAARGFATLAGASGAAGKLVACIGESTAAEARAAGLCVDAIGDEGLDGLCDALTLAVSAKQR